ncbi:uncharacterized protein LOC144721071 [Lampetra planeri]
MALLQQIRLLSWKNGWTLLRTPFLPISVVVWPCILFIIIAILRIQSPPQQRSACYLPAQTLPSGGFFPFLQSLVCDSAPECKNTSYLHSSTSRSRSLLYQGTGPDEAMVFQTMKLVRLHRQTVDAEMPRLQQDVDRILSQLEVNFTQVWDATNGTELGEYPALWRNLSHTLLGRVLSSTGFNTDGMIFAQNMKILWCSQLTGMAENITTALSSQLSIYELKYFIANLLPTFNSTMQSWCNSDQSLLVEGLNTLNQTVTALNVTKIMDLLLNVNSSMLTKIEDGILMLEGVQKQSEYTWQGVKDASSILMALTDAKAWSSLDSVTASLKGIKALVNVSKGLTSSYAELQPPMELIELILQAAISILEQPANPDNTAWRDWLDQGIQKGFNKSTNGDSFNISLSLFETVLTWLEKELQDNNSSSSSSGTFWGLGSTDVSSVRVALRQARLWLPLLRQSARVYDWSSEGYAWALGVAEQALDGLQFGAEISKVLQAVQAVRDVILHATKLNTELLVLVRQVVTVIAENIDLMASDANRRVDLLGQMIADADVFVTEVKQKLQQNRSLSCMDLMVLWDMLPADILTDRQTVLSAVCQANTSGSLGNLTAALGHYEALQRASTTLAILVNGSQVAPSGQPPRISELYANWQSVVDAAGENVDAQAKFYNFLQQVFGVMPSPPSSTALLDSFLEHLLINLMLDVTDVVGMTVQQTLGWPSMDQLVNGLHWIISTINQQNTTSFTSKCEDIFSVPNVTLWVNAPVPWRGLISEMIVFKNNAMANDELIPRALHASMDLLNQMNIVNVDRDALNTMFCSDKNLSSLIASFQQSNSTTSATANLIQGILHDKSVTHVIALLYNNIRLWSQNSPPVDRQLYDDVSAILNRINVTKELDILNHVIEVANTTGIDNAILPLVYGVLTEIQASGLLDNQTADILNTVQTFLKVNNSEQLLAEIKQLLSWVPQDSAQNSSRRVMEFLMNVFENIIVPVLPAHDWATILQPEISQQLMMNFMNPKVVARILSEMQSSRLVDRQVTENLNIAQTFLMMNSTQQILSHVMVLLQQAQPDVVRDLSIKIVRVLFKLYQEQIIPAFPENDWIGIFQPDTFQKLILQLMSPKVLADTLAEIESSDFLDAQTAEIIRIAQTFLNLNNSQQLFSQLNYVLSHGQPDTYGNLTVSVLHVLYNIYQKHIIPQFPVDDWTALFLPGHFEKLISTLLSPGVFAEIMSEIKNAGLLNPDVTGMFHTMQGLITANTTQYLFTHLRLLLDQWQPTYPNESDPVSFSIGMLKVLLSIAEMTDQPDTVDVKWMSVIEYSLKQITRSNFIPPGATDTIVTFIKVLTFVFEPNYFNLNNTNNTMHSLVNGLSSEISAYLQSFPDLREFMPFIMKASNTAAKLLDNATSEEAISTSLEAIISLVHNLRHIVTKSNPLMPTSASVCENNLTELGMFVAEQLSNLMPDKISEEFKNMTSLILHYTDALQAFIQNRDMPMDFFISFYKENYQLIKQLSDFLKKTDNDTLQALKSDASKVKLMVSEARMSNESLNTFLELSAQLLMEIGYILNTSEHFQSIPSFSSLLFLVDMVTAENSTPDALFTNNSDITIRDIGIFLEIANSSTLLDVLQNIESLLHHLQDLQASLHNDSLLLTLRSISGIMDQCGVFLEHLHIDPAAKEVFHILNSLSDIWIQDLSVVDYGSAHTQLNVFKAFIVYVVANMDTLIPIENEVRAVQSLLRSIEPLMESVSEANADGTPLYDKLNIVFHLITNMTDISTYTLEDFWRTFGSRGITAVDILEIQAIMMTIGMYVENIYNVIVEPAMHQFEILVTAARLTELLLQMNHGSNASLPINRQTHEIMAIIMYPKSLQNISVIFQFLKIIVGDILPENGLLSLQQTETILNLLHSAETMIAIQDVDKLVYWLQNSTFYFADFLSQVVTLNDTQTLSSLTSALSIMGHFLQLQSQLDTFVSYNISTSFTEELGSIFEFYGLNNLTDILMKAIEGIQLIHQLSSRDVFGMAEIQSIFSYSQSTLTFFTDPLVEEKSIHLGSKVVRLVGMFMIQQNYSVPNMVDTHCTVLAIIDQILSTNLKMVPTAMGLLNAAKCNVSEEELNADCSLPSRNIVYCAATLAAEIVTDFSEFISFPNQIVFPEDKFQELAYIFSCNLRQMQEWTVVLLKMAQVFDFSNSLLVDLNAKTMRLLDHIAETQLDICDDHSNPLAVSLILTLNSISDLQCPHTFKSETLVDIMTDIVYFIKTANVPVNDKFLENVMSDFQKVFDFLMQLGSIDIHETDLLLIANSTLEALNTLMENLSIHPKPNLSIFTYFINMLTMQENGSNTTAYPFPTDLNWYSNNMNINNFTTEIQEFIVFIYNSVRDDGNFSAKQLFADLGQLLVSSNASQPLKKLNFIRNINSFVHALEIAHPHIASAMKNFTVENHYMLLEEVAKTIGSLKEMNISFGNPLLFMVSTSRSLEAIIRQLQHLTPEHSSVEVERLLQSITVFEEAIGQILNSGNMTFENGLMLDSLKHLSNLLDTMQILNNSIEAEMLHNVFSLCLDIKEFAMNMGSSNSSDVIVKEVMDMFLTTFPLDIGTVVLHFFKVIEKHNFDETYFNATEIVDGMIPLIEGLRNNSKAMADNIRHLNTMKILVQVIANMTTKDDWKNLMRIENNQTWLQKHEIMSKAFSSFMTELQHSGLLDSDTAVIFQTVQSLLKVDTLDDFLTKMKISGILDEQSSYILNIIRNLLKKNTTEYLYWQLNHLHRGEFVESYNLTTNIARLMLNVFDHVVTPRIYVGELGNISSKDIFRNIVLNLLKVDNLADILNEIEISGFLDERNAKIVNMILTSLKFNTSQDIYLQLKHLLQQGSTDPSQNLTFNILLTLFNIHEHVILPKLSPDEWANLSNPEVFQKLIVNIMNSKVFPDILGEIRSSGLLDQQSANILDTVQHFHSLNTSEDIYQQLKHLLQLGSTDPSQNLTFNILMTLFNIHEHVILPKLSPEEWANLSNPDVFQKLIVNLINANVVPHILGEILSSGLLDQQSTNILDTVQTFLQLNTSEDIYQQLKYLLQQGSTDPSQNLTFNIFLTFFKIHEHVILPKLSPEEWANISNPDVFQKLILNLMSANVVTDILGEIRSSGLLDQQSANILDTVQTFLQLNTSEEIYQQLKHMLQQGPTDPSQSLTFNIFLTLFNIYDHVILPKLSPEEWENLSNPDIFQKLIVNLMSANIAADILGEIRSSGLIDQQSANILGTVQIFLQLNTSEDIYQQLKHLLQQGSTDPSQIITFNIVLALVNMHYHVIQPKLSPEEWANLSNPDVFQKLIVNLMNGNVVADILGEIRSSGFIDQQSANILDTVQTFLRLNTSEDIYQQLKHLLKQGSTDPSQSLTFNIFLTLFNIYDHVILPKLSPEEWANLSNPDIFQKLIVNLMSANVAADILGEIRSSGLLDQQSANILGTVQIFLQLNSTEDIYQQLKHLLEQGPTDPSQSLTFNIFLTLFNIYDHVIITKLSPEEWANISNPDVFQKLILNLMSANVATDILGEIRSSGLLDQQSANILDTVQTFLQLNTSEEIYQQLKHMLQQGPTDPSQSLTFNIFLTLFNIYDHVILPKLSPEEWANLSNPDIFQKLIVNLMSANIAADILGEIRSSGLIDQQSANILGTVQIFLQLNTSEDIYQQLKHLLQQGSTDPSQIITFNIVLALVNMHYHVIQPKLSPEEWANLSNPDVFQKLIVNLMNGNVVADILGEIRSSGFIDQQSANILDTVQTFLRLNTSEDIYQQLKHLLKQGSTDPSQSLTFNIFLTLFNIYDHVILPKLSPEEWANLSNPDIFQKLIVNLMSANVAADILGEIRSSGLLDQQSANILGTVQIFLQLNSTEDIYQQLKHLLEQGPTDPSQSLTFNIFLTLFNIYDHVIITKLSPEEWANISNPDVFQKLILNLMSANVVTDILGEIRSSGLLDQQSANILGTVQIFLQLNTSEDIYLQLKHLLEQGPADPSQNLTFNILLTLFNIYDHVILPKLLPEEWANLSDPNIFQKLIVNLMSGNVVADIFREIRSSGLLDQQSANILDTVQIFLRLNTSEDIYLQLKHLLEQGPADPSQNLTFNILLTLFSIHDHVILPKLSPDEWENITNSDVFQKLLVNLMNANVVADILSQMKVLGLLDERSMAILDAALKSIDINSSENVFIAFTNLLHMSLTNETQNLTLAIFDTFRNAFQHLIEQSLSMNSSNKFDAQTFYGSVFTPFTSNVITNVLAEIQASGLLNENITDLLKLVQTFLTVTSMQELQDDITALSKYVFGHDTKIAFSLLQLIRNHSSVSSTLSEEAFNEWVQIANATFYNLIQIMQTFPATDDLNVAKDFFNLMNHLIKNLSNVNITSLVNFTDKLYNELVNNDLQDIQSTIFKLIEGINLVQEISKANIYNASNMETIFSFLEAILPPHVYDVQGMNVSTLTEQFLQLVRLHMLEISNSSLHEFGGHNCSTKAVIQHLLQQNVSNQVTPMDFMFDIGCKIADITGNIEKACSMHSNETTSCAAFIAVDILNIFQPLLYESQKNVTDSLPQLSEMFYCHLQWINEWTKILLKISETLNLPCPILLELDSGMTNLSESIIGTVNTSVCLIEDDPILVSISNFLTLFSNTTSMHNFNDAIKAIDTIMVAFSAMKDLGFPDNNTQTANIIAFIKNVFALLSDFNSTANQDSFTGAKEIIRIVELLQRSFSFNVESQMASYLNFIQLLSITSERDWLNVTEHLLIGTLRAVGNITNNQLITNVADLLIQTSTIITNLNGSPDEDYAKLITALKKLNTSSVQDRVELLNIVNILRTVHQNLIDVSSNTNVSLPELLQIITNLLNSTDINFPEVNAYTLMVRKIISTMYNLSFSTGAESIMTKVGEIEQLVFEIIPFASAESRMSLNNTLNILKSISGVLNIALSTSNSTTDGEVALIKAVLSLLRVFGEERIYNGTLTADTAEGILSVYFQVLHLVANDGFSAGDVVNSSVAVMELLQVLAGEVPALNVLAPLFESARVAFLMAGGTTQQAAISSITKVCLHLSETFPSQFQPQLLWQIEKVLHGLLLNFNDVQSSVCNFLACGNTQGMFHDLLQMAVSTSILVADSQQVVRGNASCADVELASRELEDIAAQTSDGLQAFALNSCRCQSHNSSSTAHLIMRLLSIVTKNLSAAVVEQISSFITPLSLSDQATEEWIKTLIDVLTEEGNATTDEKLALVVARTGELFPRSALETQLLALQMVLRAAKDPVGELTVFGEAVLFLLVGDATERIQLLNRTVALMNQASNNTLGVFSSLDIPTNEMNAFNQVLVLDLLKDTGSLVEQLRQLTGLSEGTIAAFLGAKFTTSQVYDLTPLMMQSASQMCNEETLTLLLKFPEGTSGNVSRDLCSMSPLASIKMVITLLEHINIRNVIYKMLTPQILKDFENLLLIVVDRLLMIMQKVEPFMTTLPQLLDAVRQLNISDIMQSSQSPGARQARSTNTPSLSKLSKTFCAGTTQRMLADVRMANLPTPLPSSSLSPEDFKAKYNIPYGTSPYCLDVYTDIIHGKNGEVIWRFLKPLMLGKILYTPRSAATELLIRTANSTFQKMGELSSYAQEWLDAMGNQNANLQIQQLAILKNALANPFVQGFIRSQMNINMTSFMQNLKSFEELGVQLTDTTMDNLKTLSTLMVNISSCVELNRFVPSDSVEELNKRAVGLNKENNLMASVIFHLPEAQNRSRRAVSNLPLATHLNYTLRLSIQNVMRTDYLRDLVWVPGPHTNQNYMYYTHAFLPIQDMLERAAISLYIGRDVSEPALQVQPMPYPCYTDDLFLHSVGLMFPILFMIAWILTIASTVKFLVQEKELCQQEYMNIMGVLPASHFLSWLLQSCALLLLMVILLTVILKASGTLPSTNWALLLALFLCFGISVLAMGYMLSACFTHTNVASLTACFIYLLSFFPFLALSSLTLTLTRWQKSLICLLSPTAFSYASQLMGHFEDQGIGAQWSNMYQSPLYGDDISFAYLCWMLIIDTAIYFIVGWYIRNVYPGTYGLARPFYFLFTVSYWQQVCCCGSRRRPMGYLARNMAHESPADSKTDAKDGSMRPQLEAVPAGLTAGVSLRSLTKQYSKGKKAALQDLSLDFYEDQITTLLGHNGAGKTTTMSLLMGLYEPSSGSVHVGGRDARTDMAEVRRQLGVCLQRDVLFPALNVHEHLLLYGRLKALGWSRQRLQQEVDTFLNDLGLYNHKDKLVGTLSGGMKRKLSIAIAFIGGSTTVILDEPTSGVDPCSRRSIWNLILKHRAGRTIILSTHHLDEAEVLSDRIAVLEHGKLRCCGSPQYLKEIYGQGLTLTLTKKSGALGSRSPFDPERVVSLVRSGVEGAVLKSGEDSSGNRNADMVFLLPAHSQNVLGQSFLAILEENMEELGLSGYAISDTTLEEVFLKLVQEAEDQSLKDITNKFPEAESSSINSETAAPPDHTSPAASDTSDTVSLESEGSSQDSFEKHLVKKERVTGIHLLVHKTQALIYKRFHHWRRDVKGAAAQIVLPVILVALAMAFASMEPGVPEYPSLHLQPSLYSSASFFSLHNSSSASASSLTSTLMKHAACLDQPPSRNNSCWANRPPTSWFPSAKGDESSCSCTSCKELCSAVQDMPSYTNVNPQLQMFNLSGYDVEEYLIGTTCQYLLKRYGGWSFGLPHTASSDLEVVPDNRTLTKVWYNPEGYHALPAYVNSLNNLLLWDNLPEGEHPGDYRISVNSKPYAGQQLSQDMILQNLGDTGVAICILLGFSIITGSFATAVVRERITGSKRLQQISGVSPTFYWAVNFAYDMLSYSVTTGLCIAVIAAFHLPAYTDNSNLGAVSLLLILFGFASLPWMYLLSGIFSEEEMAFVTYISINIILGVTTIISTFLVNFLYLNSDSESLYNAYNVMRWLFLVFPQFCLGWGLVSLSKQRLMEDIMTLLGSDPQESSSFAMDITGWPFVALAVNGLVCFTLRLVLTDELIWKLRRRWQRQAVEPGQPELDTDVQAERSRVEDAATPDDALQLVGLRKRYRLLSRSFTAVDGLHLGVSPNQCFGLLGVNGAGKTTTFKMLTGDIQPSGGDAIIRTQNGAFLKMDKARRTGTLIGYCPQFDALDDLLTGWEHLYCYARIRGIPSHHIEQVSQELVTRLHLSLHVDKLVKTYSGGTKRKLSTALALIGKPQLLLLDEPSSGMDPKSKRYLWKTITREVRQGCSVVLTSHSMEECEALCDKLAIMVNGQFKCLGTLQHLKNRFGNGHMIKLRLSSGNSKVTEVTEFITSHFPGAYLKEQHISQLEFQVPSNAAKLSEIFIALEKEKESLSIQHYSISQTTLDQVFINFARQQIDMEEESSNADARPPVPTV